MGKSYAWSMKIESELERFHTEGVKLCGKLKDELKTLIVEAEVGDHKSDEERKELSEKMQYTNSQMNWAFAFTIGDMFNAAARGPSDAFTAPIVDFVVPSLTPAQKGHKWDVMCKPFREKYATKAVEDCYAISFRWTVESVLENHPDRAAEAGIIKDTAVAALQDANKRWCVRKAGEVTDVPRVTVLNNCYNRWLKRIKDLIELFMRQLRTVCVLCT